MNRIKDLRKQKGLTQEELGKLLNVQKAAVSKYELGRAVPSTDVLMKLAEIFGVTTDYILGRPSSSSELWRSISLESIYPPAQTAKQLGLSPMELSFLEHGKDDKVSERTRTILIRTYQALQATAQIDDLAVSDIYNIIEDEEYLHYKGKSYPLDTSLRAKLHTAIELVLPQ